MALLFVDNVDRPLFVGKFPPQKGHG